MTEHDGARTESATERLRAMLDERGVEYETDDTQVSDTEWYYVTKLRDGYRDRWTYEEPPDCDLLVSYQYDLGAKDAIAATLGAGTCHVECFDDGIDEALDGSPIYTTPTWYLSCGHTCEGAERPSFCKNCGRKVVDE